MKQIFHVKNRSFVALLYLVLFITPLFFTALFGELRLFLEILFVVTLLYLPLFLYFVYIFSYRLEVADSELIETQLFRKERRLRVSEITSIEISYRLRLLVWHAAERSWEIRNPRYRKFPRYPLSDGIINALKETRNDLTIAAQSPIETRGGKTVAVYFAAFVILAVSLSLFRLLRGQHTAADTLIIGIVVGAILILFVLYLIVRKRGARNDLTADLQYQIVMKAEEGVRKFLIPVVIVFLAVFTIFMTSSKWSRLLRGESSLSDVLTIGYMVGLLLFISYLLKRKME